MPLDPKGVEAEMRRGLSIVCATCRKYWRAKDAGLAGCGEKCFGPISGGNFAEYDGELPDLERWCFVCGADSVYALQVGQEKRRVGVCQAHLTHLHELAAKDGLVRPGGQLYAARGGSMIRVERLIAKPPKTLASAIAATEEEWEEEDQYLAEKHGIDPDQALEG